MIEVIIKPCCGVIVAASIEALAHLPGWVKRKKEAKKNGEEIRTVKAATIGKCTCEEDAAAKLLLEKTQLTLF